MELADPVVPLNEDSPVENEEVPVEGWTPGVDFLEEVKDPLVEISLTDSTELWLIQWPLNHLQHDDLNGKDIKFMLHGDRDLGSFTDSSGKSYELVSYDAQEPDASVFIASSLESKTVGKISRRVCLVHYPEPSELEKSKPRPTSSCYRPGGSWKSSMLSSLMTPKKGDSDHNYGISHATLTSAHSVGQSSESTKRSKHKAARASPSSMQTGRSSGLSSSQVSKPESQLTDRSSGSAGQSHDHCSAKKKIKSKQKL